MTTPGDVLSQTTLDSGALRGLTAILHKFAQPGSHLVSVINVDEPGPGAQRATPVGVLSVDSVSPLTAEEATAFVQKSGAGIDLAHALGSPPATPAQNIMQAIPGGYALFHAQEGASGLAVTLQPDPAKSAAPGPAAAQGVAEQFDSRQLGTSDVYGLTLAIPGTYGLTNALDGKRGTITVAAPKTVPGTPYRPAGPLMVECTAGGFVPDTLTLGPLQGLLVKISTPARIKVEPVKAGP